MEAPVISWDFTKYKRHGVLLIMDIVYRQLTTALSHPYGWVMLKGERVPVKYYGSGKWITVDSVAWELEQTRKITHVGIIE